MDRAPLDFLMARLREDIEDVAGGPCTCGDETPHAYLCPLRAIHDLEVKYEIARDCFHVVLSVDDSEMGSNGLAAALRTILHLAVVYADHPDYRNEWMEGLESPSTLDAGLYWRVDAVMRRAYEEAQ